MKAFDIYKKYYSLDNEELSLIKDLPQIIEENFDLFIRSLLAFYTSENSLKSFFNDKENKERFEKNARNWLKRLFKPPFDKDYAKFIKKIGIVHANNNVNPHYINVGIGLIRHTLTSIIRNYYESVDERVKIINIVNKILDYNLDIINSNARERDLENKFLKVKLENTLLKFSENFAHFLNIIIVIMLVILSVAILAFFVKDFSMILHGEIEKGIITTLGTMLILWMMLELIEVEIKNLKTKKINIVVFINVVLVAFVRKILIATFEQPEIEKQIFLVGTVLILALVNFLISRTDNE
jgi:uncharacterized membrane protein (DUF373 family)